MFIFKFSLVIAAFESITADLYRHKIGNKTIVGTLQATADKTVPYVAFRGIPYAKPPVDNLRFRPPEPADDWHDEYDATYDRSACVQKIPVIGSEDCLYLNVYVPLIRSQVNRLPVLVWIHQGAFIAGNSSYEKHGPDYFLNEDVLFVSFNYRLGIFGFLSTGDLVSPGNYGLKDQILALRWIKQNIASFGGDPNQVTIFGESAGAASVSYLLQTNLTRGLFQKAISNSGTSLSQWALSRKAPRVAEIVAMLLDIDTSNSSTIVDGLRKVNYGQLQIKAFATQIEILDNILHGLIYAPTIEPEHDGAVVLERSHFWISQGNFHKVPYLLGFTSKEAGGWLSTKLLEIPLGILGAGYMFTYALIRKRFVPIDMNVEEEKQTELGEKIVHKYFSKRFLITTSSKHFESFISDDQFVRPIRETVRIHSQAAPVYYYRFAYEGDMGLTTGINRDDVLGVSHAEDLRYFFRQTARADLQSTEEDFRTRYRLLRMWCNFVKTGNPTPNNDFLLENVKWPTARISSNSSVLSYLNIDEHLTVRQNPEEDFMNSWQNWYDQYGRPPYGTF